MQIALKRFNATLTFPTPEGFVNRPGYPVEILLPGTGAIWVSAENVSVGDVDTTVAIGFSLDKFFETDYTNHVLPVLTGQFQPIVKLNNEKNTMYIYFFDPDAANEEVEGGGQ